MQDGIVQHSLFMLHKSKLSKTMLIDNAFRFVMKTGLHVIMYFVHVQLINVNVGIMYTFNGKLCISLKLMGSSAGCFAFTSVVKTCIQNQTSHFLQKLISHHSKLYPSGINK